jgi:hypothetical protein
MLVLIQYYEGKSKVKGLLKKHVFYIYINETNITFQPNPPRLQRTGSSVSQVLFLILPGKSFLVASLTSFAPRQLSDPIVTADETWVHYYEPESKAQNVWPNEEALRGRSSSDEEVVGAVQNWLKMQPKNFFFSDGIEKLVKRWNR